MNTLNLKHTVLSLIILILGTSTLFSACGSCSGDSQIIASKKTSALVTTIPESGAIEGFVISSCGMCNFGYKKIKGCNLTIKIEDKIYPVEGSKIHDHGDPHSEEGFCSAVRIAYVSGKIKKNTFYSDSFTLIESPK